MKTIPNLAEADIRPLATDQSWSRGEDYFYSNSVENIVWRDGLLTAEVEGSEYKPYIVQARFDQDKIHSTHCTCPYDWGGDCKHIIATLLYLCHRRDDGGGEFSRGMRMIPIGGLISFTGGGFGRHFTVFENMPRKLPVTAFLVRGIGQPAVRVELVFKAVAVGLYLGRQQAIT